MSLRDINLKIQYNPLEEDIVSGLYMPCLRDGGTIEYKRAVAFFTSDLLLELSKGIGALVDRGGKMKLLVSPKLGPDDYEAIVQGYDLREKLTEQIVNDFFFDFDADFDQKDARYEMLAYMIAHNLLEVKIVILRNLNENLRGMFHRKTGIFIDSEGNKVVFCGSGNEGGAAAHRNDEIQEVYGSWYETREQQRVEYNDNSFDIIWNDDSKCLISIPFPEVIKNKILSYKSDGDKKYVDIDLNYINSHTNNRPDANKPLMKDTIKLRNYQKDAVSNWAKHNYQGIFDMATGAGKTFAAGQAICELYKDKKRVFVVVCCPQKHLVEQWGEALTNFNIEALVYHGETHNYDNLERFVNKFKHHSINFGCVVTTNDSYQNSKFQKLLNMVVNDTLLIVDEAHNFGATKASSFLLPEIPYRLALSATFERHRDDEGTSKLFDFFGEKCIEYTLKQAIDDHYLCHYIYRPIVTYLTPDEYDKYIELSLKAVPCQEDGKLTDKGELLLIQRAHVVAGAQNKFDALRNVIEPYAKNKNTGMLIYCGTYKYEELDDKRQIELVSRMLNHDLGISATTFTSEENSKTRKVIIDDFKNGDIQAIVAIKCLDEGVDIPAIRTAFILASSTNPREYIQRRGRILRTYPGKTVAEIYDFITLPFKRGTYRQHESYYPNIDKGLVSKEIARMEEFADLSDNSSEYFKLMRDLKDEYGLDKFDAEESELL